MKPALALLLAALAGCAPVRVRTGYVPDRLAVAGHAPRDEAPQLVTVVTAPRPADVIDAPGQRGCEGEPCDACARGQHVLGCVVARAYHPAAPPSDVAIATHGDEIAVATAIGSSVPGPNGPGSAVIFQRFGADLRPLGGTFGISGVHQFRVALAATRSGWLLAADGGGVRVYAIPREGSTAAVALHVPDAHLPRLAGRPDGGGPLLAYIGRSGEVRAVVLREDGAPATEPALVFQPHPVEYEYCGAAFAGDGFLVTARQRGALVARVDLAGRVGQAYAPGRDETEYPQVAWTPRGGAVTWADFGSGPHGLRLVAVDAHGVPRGRPVALDRERPVGSDWFNVAPIAPAGDDGFVVLYGGYTGGTGIAHTIAVQRVGPDGAARTPVLPLSSEGQSAPRGQYRAWRVAQRGADTIAAWLDVPARRVVLARARP